MKILFIAKGARGIADDKTGRLVDFFDAAGLASELFALLDDPGARARVGGNARAWAQAHVDLGACACRGSWPGRSDWRRSGLARDVAGV